MGARYREDTGRWFCDFWVTHPDGRRERVRRYPPLNTRKSAIEHERKIRREVAAGTWRRDEAPTLRVFAQAFMAEARLQLKRSTCDRYDTMLKHHLLRRWGSRCIDTIGPADVAQFKAAQVDAGLSKKTVNNQLGLLSSMLHRAQEWGQLPRVPKIKLFKLPRPKDREYRWISREEADQLVAAAWGYWPAMFTVALNTGLRMGELQALRWSDVDLRRRRLVVRRSWWDGTFDTPKSGKNREIPLNAQAVDALESHPRMLRCELVFHTSSGNVIDKPDMNKGLWRVCKAAGLERFSWHTTRHTFASWLVAAGVPLRTVQQLLGHSTITMTERYAHVAPASEVEAVAALDRM